MEDWQTRVLNERTELADKVEKLRVFVNDTDKFKYLPNTDKHLMMAQLSVMEEYFNILNDRISRFK